jgi:hypothetical protein
MQQTVSVGFLKYIQIAIGVMNIRCASMAKAPVVGTHPHIPPSRSYKWEENDRRPSNESFLPIYENSIDVYEGTIMSRRNVELLLYPLDIDALTIYHAVFHIS